MLSATAPALLYLLHARYSGAGSPCSRVRTVSKLTAIYPFMLSLSKYEWISQNQSQAAGLFESA